MESPVYLELTQEEIVQRLEAGARERLGLSAADLKQAFESGTLEDPCDLIDILGLAAMLDLDHALYIDF